jgi:hypothetical protein
MKIAVIGTGLRAASITLRLLNEEASVLLFSDAHHPFGHAHDLAQLGFDEGLQALRDRFSEIEKLGGQLIVHPVKRVQKRFLRPMESVSKGSRLKDLFRVVIERNPEMIDGLDVERFQKELGEKFVEELERKHELFFDVDLVIAVPENGVYHSYQYPGPWALHQEGLSPYLDFSLQGLAEVKNGRRLEIALIGDTTRSAYALLALKDALLSLECTVHVITHKERAFADNDNQALAELFDRLLKDYEQRCAEFTQRVREHRDAHARGEQVQSLPGEPKLPLIFYEGFSLTALDRLSDREHLYLTLETPDFRTKGGSEKIKTLEVDRVFFLEDGAPSLSDYSRGFTDDEPGAYCLAEDERDPLGQRQFEKVWTNVLQYFSKN